MSQPNGSTCITAAVNRNIYAQRNEYCSWHEQLLWVKSISIKHSLRNCYRAPITQERASATTSESETRGCVAKSDSANLILRRSHSLQWKLGMTEKVFCNYLMKFSRVLSPSWQKFCSLIACRSNRSTLVKKGFVKTSGNTIYLMWEVLPLRSNISAVKQNKLLCQERICLWTLRKNFCCMSFLERINVGFAHTVSTSIMSNGTVKLIQLLLCLLSGFIMGI